jgi:hypothetical protein
MEKRKFLFVSLSGLIGDIAWQVLKEGHDVRYYIEAEKSATSPTVSSPNPGIGKKTPNGRTSSFLMTLSARVPKPRPFALPASPSSAAHLTQIASKMIALSVRNSLNPPESASSLMKILIPLIPPSNS